MRRKIGTALVVGGGISGIRSALDLAEFGYGVTLIDRAPHLGGILSQLDHQFPTDRCGMCKMLPLVDRDTSSQFCLRKGLFHDNIEIRLATELAAVEGEPGRFQVTLSHTPNPVDSARCIGCNRCVEVCPVSVPDDFNAGLGTRKAIYLPVPHAIPNPFRIDTAACTECGACVEVCPTDAIHLTDPGRKTFRILVVDDELIVRDSLKEWLVEESGFSVETAESGQAALEMLTAGDYALMLTDIKMPGMDGVTLLQKAMEIRPDLTVVMMTAYATVETAVEAMKIGALDYLIKPFDPDLILPKIVQIYQKMQAASEPPLSVGAIVWSGGSAYFDPKEGTNTYGYGEFPDVVTSLEFERLISGTGPTAGKLTRPSDGAPVNRIAWAQCVGSRDLQTGADFCSNICCMYAVKEAMLARDRARQAGLEIDTALYYMDMRTFEKPFQRYRDRAESAGVRFERARIHSVIPNRKAGGLQIRVADLENTARDESVDLVVLAVGQRPAAGTAELAETLGIGLNPWGYPESEPFSLTRTARKGVLLSGAVSGLKDISESVIQAGAAANAASLVIHGAGGSLAEEGAARPAYTDVSREMPRILALICTCQGALDGMVDQQELTRALRKDPAVARVRCLDRICTADGWADLVKTVRADAPNRVLIGSCLPYVYARKLKDLGVEIGLDPRLMDVVDLRSAAFPLAGLEPAAAEHAIRSEIRSRLMMAVARLKRADLSVPPTLPVHQRALVVGGGIAGMHAALAIGEHGYPVDLVERSDRLGGNLLWLGETIEGHDTHPLLEETMARVEQHPQITCHMGSRVLTSFGQVGRFITTLENPEGDPVQIEHGAAVLATGGVEAPTDAYGHGTLPGVVTQRTFETQWHAGEIAVDRLNTVVMIQCVGSREATRNYCSRVCCTTALKQALRLRKARPDARIFVFYRDMMSYGFNEHFFTQARKSRITFIPYTLDRKPEVAPRETGEAGVSVTGFEPIIGREVRIDADLLVLATGVNPTLPAELATFLGAEQDEDGFFQEAEFKWRPVDGLREGVFACGLAHSPRAIAESVATAEAAAQRALRILCRERIAAGHVTAAVHDALCARCERCIPACPYHARILDPETDRIVVNAAMCQGCGACAAACPNGAAYIAGWPAEQMLETIDAAFA